MVLTFRHGTAKAMPLNGRGRPALFMSFTIAFSCPRHASPLSTLSFIAGTFDQGSTINHGQNGQGGRNLKETYRNLSHFALNWKDSSKKLVCLVLGRSRYINRFASLSIWKRVYLLAIFL
jgi:hypothetical protein